MSHSAIVWLIDVTTKVYSTEEWEAALVSWINLLSAFLIFKWDFLTRRKIIGRLTVSSYMKFYPNLIQRIQTKFRCFFQMIELKRNLRFNQAV